MTAVKPVPLLNAANVLTVARMVLVPVFVVFVVAGGGMTDTGWQVAAGITFVIASATDYVDGYIARTHNLVTSFGKVADPIADKALTGAALVMLSLYDRLPWWVTAVILVREWGVTALRFWVLRHGVIAASRGGKAKTALQILAIGWYLTPLPDGLAAVGPWIMAAAVVVTVVTGLDYVMRAYRVRRDALRRHRSPAGGSLPPSPDGPASGGLAPGNLVSGVLPSGGSASGGLPSSGLASGGLSSGGVQEPMLSSPAPAPAVAAQADEPVT